MRNYLRRIFADFKKAVGETDCLCSLKGLTFQAGKLPDYGNVIIQQLYLLRYAYAYIFEYICVYLEVLKHMRNMEQISVTSVGCGSMLDYVSLVAALGKRSADHCKIEYAGIDTIDWNYKVGQREIDEVSFIKEDAVQYFADSEKLSSDIYFFPKSISEFNEGVMGVIEESFFSKPIPKDQFFVCITIRKNQGSMQRDMEKTNHIIHAIEKNGFVVEDRFDQGSFAKENKAIICCDNRFRYPDEVLDYVKELNKKCRCYVMQGAGCDDTCENSLTRSPILKTGNIRYEIIEFKRRKK